MTPALGSVMREREAEDSLVVVLERGAGWPSWVVDRWAPVSSTVVAQEPRELPQALVLRVQQRLRGLAQRALSPAFATISLGWDCREEIQRAREVLAHSMLAHLPDSGCLVLAATETCNEVAQQALLNLAGKLAASLTGSRSLSVVFGKAGDPSRRASLRPGEAKIQPVPEKQDWLKSRISLMR